MAISPVTGLEKAWRKLMQTMSSDWTYAYSKFRQQLWIVDHVSRKR